MKINKEKLEEIIKKVLNDFEIKKEEKNVYIVFSYPWSNLYYFALEELKKIDIPLRAVISERISNDYLKEIKEVLSWEEIITFNEETNLNLKNSKVIFLKLSRNNVIDIANMYANNFETNLVKKLIGEGENIYYWDKGLEKITTKETKQYQKKLLKYYEEILEFGIYPIELKAVKE